MISRSSRYAGVFPKSLNHYRLCTRAPSFVLPQGHIQKGYGEYIFAHLPSPQHAEPLSLSEHHAIYDLAARVDREGDHYSDLKAALQNKLGPDVFPIFVPRTVYELCFLEECIREDLSYGDLRSADEIALHLEKKEGGYRRDFYLEALSSEEDSNYKKIQDLGFWKLCHYSNKRMEIDLPGLDIRERHLRAVSARLNQEIVNRFKKEHGGLAKEGLVFKEIQRTVTNLIEFHSALNAGGDLSRKAAQICFSEKNPGHLSSLEGLFSLSRHSYPRGIHSPRDRKIVEKSVQLECSEKAANSLLLYRGSPREKESLDQSVSLSYGTGLFAGSLYDGGATAFGHMKQKPVAKALLVARDCIPDCFFIPKSSALEQLCSKGEDFHGRTKVPRENERYMVSGYASNVVSPHIVGDQSLEDMQKAFASIPYHILE